MAMNSIIVPRTLGGENRKNCPQAGHWNLSNSNLLPYYGTLSPPLSFYGLPAGNFDLLEAFGTSAGNFDLLWPSGG